MREEIRNFWEQAKADLRTARNSLNSKDYYASVFWCQQAIEKALKAYIMLNQKKSAGPIHSLIKLGKIAKVPKQYEIILKNIAPEYYIARYPDASGEIPYQLYEEEDNVQILKNTEDFFKWMNTQIQK